MLQPVVLHRSSAGLISAAKTRQFLAPHNTEVISPRSFENDIVWKNMQELLLNDMNNKGGLLVTSSLLPIIVYLCTNNVITQFLVAFMSSFTVIETLFYLTWTKRTDCSISW